MKIQELGEFGLIEKIRKVSGQYKGHPEIILGIGDDCAEVKLPSGGSMLFTTDTVVEGVHFSKEYYGSSDIGYKAMAVNLSDIAAMGGIPQYCLVTLGLKQDTTPGEVEGIYRGINALGAKHGVKIIGGDIIKSPESLFVSITAIGKPAAASSIKRSGAKPGDIIYATGTFGDSSIGYYILDKGIEGWRNTVNRHLRPQPRIDEGIFIAKTGAATSMIDSSDGFDKSIRLICLESKTGCKIRLDKIPVSKEVEKFSAKYHLNWNRHVLFGGEEYELIFTAPENKKHLFEKRFVPVGKITKGSGVLYTDSKGAAVSVNDGGFDHFKTEY